MASDKDLLSVQQARDMVRAARKAWESYGHSTQEQVDRIVGACARAASSAAYELAKLAVEETGFGVLEHKFIKNKFAADEVYRFIRDMKTVGIIREIPERRVVEIAEPVGVVAAVIPSTNPTSTAIYKILISLKSRNAIVLSPHPSAKRCILRTTEIMKQAALGAGAPESLVECMTEVSIEGTQELMSHRQTSVILATGGMGLVRAAYSSGKPAFGVGPGNVPAYIESSADVAQAVRDVLTGKSYDNGTLCCSEQALVCDRAIESEVRAAVVREGGYFLSKDQIDVLARVAVLPSRLANPEIVGKSARFIADKAGFSVPEGTRVLVAELGGVGREYPLSIEKLSPILAFYVVRDWREGCERAKAILAYGGMGHTLSIHSRNDDIIREFALQKPAFRIVANSPATHGAVGFSTGLSPAMTLGCGAYGGNITSDNITPMHLLNVKRLAYGIKPVDIGKALEQYGYPGERTAPEPARAQGRPAPAQASSSVGAPTAPVPGKLERNISRFLEARGFPTSDSRPSATDYESDRVPAKADEAGVTVSGNVGGSPGTLGGTVAPPPAVAALDFVSEDDVRSALSDGRKLPVGPGTLITPSARDLGNENNIFLRV
jgi:acetaldehyde dehydrogenase (acetylating)